MIYEVKVGYQTVEWTDRLAVAEEAFRKCNCRQAVMYMLDRSTSNKYVIRTKD